MAKIGKVQEVPIVKLVPYERNAKIHNENQIEKIVKSIQEFGFLNPCLIDKDNNVIAGHGRVMAAKKLGWHKIPCLYIEGLTEAQRRAYILADNRLSELAEWDRDLISEELETLKAEGFDILLTGFSIDDIVIDDDFGVEHEASAPQIVETKAQVKRGEVYALGQNRLMCGDSTKTEDVQKLMGGEYADLLETDPPYNVAVQNSVNGQTIENDNLPDHEFRDFLFSAMQNASNVMKQGAAFYIWHASSTALIFMQVAEEVGLTVKSTLIWVKNHFTLGRADYQWQHEPCLYGWKEGAPHYFIDLRSLSTIYDGENLQDLSKEDAIEQLALLRNVLSTAMREKVPTRDDLHPTMKPVSLIKKQIRNSSKEGDIVLDLFGGSGTTLVACEEMNRRCFMMEYDEHYASVIVDRWEKQTGEKAERIDG